MGGPGPETRRGRLIRSNRERLQPMLLSSVRAVMVFVDDPSSAALWWSSITGVTVNAREEFRWLNLPGGVELGFHPADDAHNPRGASPVVYWSVEDLAAARTT